MDEKPQLKKGDALLVVDVQNDFCPGGTLAVAGGNEIIPVINSWIDQAEHRGIPIYASRDWHPANHLSFKNNGGRWPPHCVQDTPGARFHPDLALPEAAVIVTKGVRLDQDQNSAFDQTGLGVDLKRKGIHRLFICGLALDVCVLASMLDAAASGLDVFLISNATRPVNPDKVSEVEMKMKQAGVHQTGESIQIHAASPAGDDAQPRAGEAEVFVCTKAPEWAEHQRLNDVDEPCDDGRSGKI